VQLLCKELQLLLKTLEQFDQQIGKVFQQHTDRPIFEAFPGAGPVLAPRLLASMGSERERFARPDNLHCLSGVAPVTKQSGGKCYIHRRYCCPKFLKNKVLHEYAKESILHSRWASGLLYWQQRNKGWPSHHTAPCGRWPTNGSASSGSAGRLAPFTRRRSTRRALRKTKARLVGLLDQIELGKSPVKTRGGKNLKKNRLSS